MKMSLHRAVIQRKAAKARLTKIFNHRRFIGTVVVSKKNEAVVTELENNIRSSYYDVLALLEKLCKSCTAISIINEGEQEQDYIASMHVQFYSKQEVQDSVRAAQEVLSYRQKFVEVLVKQQADVKNLISCNGMDEEKLQLVDPLNLETLITRLREHNTTLENKIKEVKEFQLKEKRFIEYCSEQAALREQEKPDEATREEIKKHHQAFEDRRMQEMKSKIWDYDKSKCAIQYDGKQEPPFQQIALKEHYARGIGFKYTDFLEFYVEEKLDDFESEYRVKAKFAFQGVHMRIKKDSNYEIPENYFYGAHWSWRDKKVNIFNYIINEFDIYRLIIDGQLADVPWRYWKEGEKEYGYIEVSESNGAQEAFLDDEGNLVIHIA